MYSDILRLHSVAKRQGKLWDESKHPRNPEGSSQGGRFTEVLHGPKDALDSLLNHEHASIDPGDLRRFLDLAAELEDDPKDPPNLLHLHVDGYTVFDQKGLGIERKQMPQVPREHRDNFLKEAREAGITVTKEWVDPLDLLPTQDEVSARNAGQKLIKYETKEGKKFPPLLISEEGRILDGHHHWAMMVAVAIDVPNIHVKVPVYRLNMPVAKAIAFMHAYDKKYDIKRVDASGAAQKYDPNEPRDEKGQWTSSGVANDYPSFSDYEAAWAGGVGDFGDADAATYIQAHPEYYEYHDQLVQELEQQHGSTITVYRAVSDDAYEGMKSGESLGPIGVTTNPELAKNWAKFAQNVGKSFKILKTTIEPEQAVMRGKAEESEIVVEGDSISFHTWEQIGTATHKGFVAKFDPNEPRDEKGRWTDSGASDDPPNVGPRIGFVAADGQEHVARKTGGLAGYAEDHTEAARRLLGNPEELNSIRVLLQRGYIRYWVRDGELALNFYAGQPKTVTHALKFLKDNYQHGDRVYLDIENGDSGFFDDLGAVNRAIHRASRVTKADPATGRYVTPFVSFDKQGDDQLRMIASLNSSRLATWGFTAEAEVRGMGRYRITAVLDGRTSEFCRFIDGKIFDVADAREKVIEALNVQDPEDLRIVQPWPKQTREAMEQFREMGEDELVARGLHIPPYHPYCRTLLRPITSSQGELTEDEVTPILPEGTETFQPITLADLEELGIEATQENVDLWNAHIGMSPVELLSKLSGVTPQDVMTEGVGSKSIQFDEAAKNIGFQLRGEDVSGVEFKLGAVLDPFTGIYYLNQADLIAGTPKAEANFLKRMFSALIGMGEASTATEIAVGVAGNAAYYAKLGFLPDEIEWDTIRQYALDSLETTLQPMLASLSVEDQTLVKHLLQDKSPSALSALVELPFTYGGQTIGEVILEATGGTWSLDLLDLDLVEQTKAYLS